MDRMLVGGEAWHLCGPAFAGQQLCSRRDGKATGNKIQANGHPRHPEGLTLAHFQ